MSELRILPAGDRALLIEFGQEISPAIQARVTSLANVLEQEPYAGVTEWVPTYRSLLVYFDPVQVKRDELTAWLQSKCGTDASVSALQRRRITLPVLYGGSEGPDLPFVAEHNKLQINEVTKLHQEPDYLVYMLGFMPGFPYLGGLPATLTTPRLATPRTTVPAGSVGIADRQTGVYPLTSPGGWQLIGRTPVRLFEPTKSEPFLLRAGDLLRFRAVCQEEYREIAAQVERQSYTPQIEEVPVHG